MDKWFDEAESNTVPGVALYVVSPCRLFSPSLSPCLLAMLYSHTLTYCSHRWQPSSTRPRPSRAVSTEEGQALAEAHGALFCGG